MLRLTWQGQHGHMYYVERWDCELPQEWVRIRQYIIGSEGNMSVEIEPDMLCATYRVGIHV